MDTQGRGVTRGCGDHSVGLVGIFTTAGTSGWLSIYLLLWEISYFNKEWKVKRKYDLTIKTGLYFMIIWQKNTTAKDWLKVTVTATHCCPALHVSNITIYSNKTLYSSLNNHLPQLDLLNLVVLGLKKTLALPVWVTSWLWNFRQGDSSNSRTFCIDYKTIACTAHWSWWIL